MALSNKGKDQDAIKYYEDAIKIDPSQDSHISILLIQIEI